MEKSSFFTKSILSQKVVHVTDRCIRALSCCHYLVNQIVDLSINAVIANTKYPTFSRRFKIDWSGLERIMGILGLLGIIPTVMSNTVEGARLVL